MEYIEGNAALDIGREALEIEINPEEFETLVEVFRTLKKWSDEAEHRKRGVDGCHNHQ